MMLDTILVLMLIVLLFILLVLFLGIVDIYRALEYLKKLNNRLSDDGK